MEIRIKTMRNGKTDLDNVAKSGVTLGEILEIAECEVYGGYADYAVVTVDGKVYAEYEA